MSEKVIHARDVGLNAAKVLGVAAGILLTAWLLVGNTGPRMVIRWGDSQVVVTPVPQGPDGSSEITSETAQ